MTSRHPAPITRRAMTAATGLAMLAAITVSVSSAATAADPAPVAGAQTSGDSLFPNVGNGGYDVSHYDLDLTYDAGSKGIEATTTIDATADAPLSSFSLDFEGLTIESLTVDGVPATFTRDIDADTTKYKLVVTPATPVSGDFTTVVTYSGIPTSHTDPDGSSEGWVETADGATFVNEPVGAMTLFPNNNTMTDKATYDVSVTIPSEIDAKPAAAVSNGELVSKVVDGDTTTWSWEQKKQMASYLSMISIGQFTVHEGDISLGDGRAIKEYSFIDSSIAGDDLTQTEESRAELPTMLNYLEKRYGTYPGNSTGILVDNTNLGYALETQDRPFFEGNVDTSTLLHELTHQWFGDAVSATDWSDLWLAEGPATFAEAQFAYDDGQTETTPEDYFHNAWSATKPTSSTWTTPMAGFTDPARLFGGQVYNRGAQSLQALRTTIGDADFDEIMSTWISTHRGATGSTADWIDLAEDVTGLDLTAFYQDWAYDTDKPAWPVAMTATPKPTITGTRAVGKPLTAVPGTWDDGVALTYQWFGDGKAITGATGSSWTPTAGMLGEHITVTVTGTKVGSKQASSTSSATGAIGRGTQVKHPTPRITGTTKVGYTLRVRPGTWDAGTKLTYRWYVSGSGATNRSGERFVIPRSAKGHRISVRVTSTKTGYHTATELSAKSTVVK